jgi:hypothetical protein
MTLQQHTNKYNCNNGQPEPKAAQHENKLERKNSVAHRHPSQQLAHNRRKKKAGTRLIEHFNKNSSFNQVNSGSSQQLEGRK